MGIWASLIFGTGIKTGIKNITESDNLNVFIENFGVVMLTIVSFSKNKNFDITPTVAYTLYSCGDIELFFSACHILRIEEMTNL